MKYFKKNLLENHKFIFFIFVIIFQSSRAFSQKTLESSSFKRTTAAIVFSGIGGGILGLSTLSFYGKPQEHTDNITTGVLLGLIAGISYYAYDTYQVSQVSWSPWIPESSLIKKDRLIGAIFTLNFNY